MSVPGVMQGFLHGRSECDLSKRSYVYLLYSSCYMCRCCVCIAEFRPERYVGNGINLWKLV